MLDDTIKIQLSVLEREMQYGRLKRRWSKSTTFLTYDWSVFCQLL